MKYLILDPLYVDRERVFTNSRWGKIRPSAANVVIDTAVDYTSVFYRLI